MSTDTTPAETDALMRRLLESEIRLREATLDVYATLGATTRDISFAVSDGANFGGHSFAPPHYTSNTKTGELLPVYRSEAELTVIRDRSRIMSAYNEFALCAIENRVNYVVGDGLKYAAAPRDPHSASHRASAKAVQEVMDEWSEVNDSAALEAETLSRLDTEGEAFLRVFTAKGVQHVRFVEPEHVKAPVGDSTNRADSYGVITDPDDVATVKGYWIVETPAENPNPTEVPAEKVLHLKLNTRANAKRGLPTLFPVESNLKRCEDLLASMSSMAKARAKIALIRKITGLTSATASSMLDRITAARATDPANGQTLNVEQLRYGSILTASGNTDYQMPAVQLGASDIVEVLQAELRAVASRLKMPEWMFTAKADAKFDNAFIGEAPALKEFGRVQRVLRNGFGLCRYGHRASLMWRQLRAAVEYGRLVAADLENVVLTCEGPTLEARDRTGEVTRHEKLVSAGFESKETAQRQLGLDPDAERPLIAAEQIGRARPVADSTAVAQIQSQFYAGQLPRDAAAANLMLLLGFTREHAEALLPASDCVKRIDDGSRDDAPQQPAADIIAAAEPAREQIEYTEAEAMRLTEADRSKLTKKEITDKNGHKRTVWVRNDTASGADAHTATKDTPHESPVHAVLRDPSKVTPEQAAAVVEQLRAMPKEQLRQLSLAIRERIGGKRAVLVDRLTEYLRKRREAGQPVAPEPKPEPTPEPKPEAVAQMDKIAAQAERAIKAQEEIAAASSKTPAGRASPLRVTDAVRAVMRARPMVDVWRYHTDKGNAAEAAEAGRRIAAQGAERLHAAGETVPFDARTMDADFTAREGDMVKVARHGWRMPNDPGEPLARAIVTRITEAAK